VSKAGGDKAPEKGVLIVGSGFGALKAAEDMAQSGIPVLWATRAHHFLNLPEGFEGYEEWPEDLNYQFRPLYLRVTRHPLVTPLPQAHLVSITRTDKGFSGEILQDPIYIDYDRCTGCSRCMEVCPLQESDHPPLARSPAFCPSRSLELEKRKLSPCRAACPLGVNVQAYMALTAAGRYDEALAVIREVNPLPGVCGRVCHHPCEAACRRNELDQPLAIRDIKRFLFDHEAAQGLLRTTRPQGKKSRRRVAVVGSGPAGLTAAHFLNQAGFAVTVFEAMAQAGGMLRAGINAFRLPRAVLDAEIQALEDEGVSIRTGQPVASLDALFDHGFKAVLLAAGTHADLKLNLKGEDLDGIISCVAFLAQVNLTGQGSVGPRTVVIGGGNSAMDAARTALRLGAETVTVLAIEREDEMPASPREVREAREEGVDFVLGAAPLAFEGSSRLERVVYQAAHWSLPEDGPPRIVFDADQTDALEADTVIVAIGQRPDLGRTGLDRQVRLGRGGRIEVDAEGRASRPGVFAAGDVVTGPSTVVESMAAGRLAAERIRIYLTGEETTFAPLAAESRGVGDYPPISEDILRQPRQEPAQRQPKVRRRDFDEVDFDFTPDQAAAEARRCLACGVCSECRACETVCADIGAIDHFRTGRRLAFESPAVIVADETELPGPIAGPSEGVYRITDLRSTTNLMDILVAASASAGQAMTDAIGLRVLAPPARPEPIAPTEEMRLGFFLCSCNQTMASPDALKRILELAAKVPDIRHSQVVVSACNAEGADRIAALVHKHRLSRVILAACICCPLEFQCISCNDQRNRARIHLFDRLGLPRERFETINLRDHLSGEGKTDDEVVDKARDLLRSAFIRSRFIEPLQHGTTEIGRRILILGGSEVGVSAARNLALQGFQVHLVHKCRLPQGDMPEAILRRPVFRDLDRAVKQTEEAVALAVHGHLGDFTVEAIVGGKKKNWRADVVCLTDENILPLAIDEDMMGLKKFYRYDFAFFHTPQIGLYRVMPRTLKRVEAYEAGAALAAQVATTAANAFLKDHLLSPRVDEERCRGCGRCADTCPFDAVSLAPNDRGGFTAQVLHYNCVGCGGCVGRCPVTALDMPYFSNQALEKMVAGALAGEL
jgi:NADPH-dependent glutamate synthase beta subunit-like oxidoreductase/Pyruvate/2-oxoacid:ferredoxin oxidoreductase delta subunit